MDFTAKMGVLLTQQTTGVERLQVRCGRPLRTVSRAHVSYLKNEIQQSNVTYNERSRQLHATLERYKQQRANNRSRIVCISYPR